MTAHARFSNVIRLVALAVVGCLIVTTAGTRRVAAHNAHPGGGMEGGHGDDGPPISAITNAVVLSNALTPFLDALPIPAVLQPSRTTNNYCVPVLPSMCFDGPLDVYDIPMLWISNHVFHSELPPIQVWGYAGQYPGPTIETEVNVPIVVNWINALTNNGGKYPYWSSIDPALFHGGHGSGVSPDQIRTVVHLHGAAVLPRYDGYPTNWFLAGQSDEYFYGNIDLNNDGQTLWYHDHAVGVTANNVYAGLAGFYLVRNPANDAARGIVLPSGKYEIPLVFQDRDFAVTTWTNTAGVQSETNLYLAGLPWHNYPVVNGKITPFLQVEPRPYRFRILNGAGFRSLALRMAITDAQGNLDTNPAAPYSPTFTVVGNEDGYLQYAASNVIRIATMPGERVDVIVDFSAYTNAPYTNITVQNAFNLPAARYMGPNGPVSGGGGGGNAVDVVGPPYVTNLMQFQVVIATTSPPPPAVVIPSPLVPDWVPTSAMVQAAVTNRQLTLDLNPDSEYLPPAGHPFIEGGGHPFALINLLRFDDPINDFPHAGDTEIWEIINLSNEAHPLHVHLLDFRVVNRQRFAANPDNLGEGWNGNPDMPPAMVAKYINDRRLKQLQPLATYLSTNSGDLNLPQAFETGPKDVVRAAPFAVTRIVMTWPTNQFFYTTPSASSGDPSTAGRYIYHCHILDHEDNDMMRPLQVLPPWQPGLALVPAPSPTASPFPYLIAHPYRANESYALESTSDPVAGPWIPAPNPDQPPAVRDTTSRTLIHTPPPHTEPRHFYRVRVTGPGQ